MSLTSLSFSKTLFSLSSPHHQHFLSPPPPQNPKAPTPVRTKTTIIRMGGGPRTYPGGVSKWQWKRMQAKKAKQLLKARLSRERQIYEMRKRAELKAAVSELERPWEPVEPSKPGNPVRNSYNGVGLFSVSADEQLKVLADRFQRPGGFDLWSERDGPQLFQTPDGLPSARFFPKGVVHSVRPYGKAVVDGFGEEVGGGESDGDGVERDGFDGDCSEGERSSGFESEGGGWGVGRIGYDGDYGVSGAGELMSNGGYERKSRIEGVDLRGSESSLNFESGSRNESRGVMERKAYGDNRRGSGYGRLRKNDEYRRKGEDVDLRGSGSGLDFEGRSRSTNGEGAIRRGSSDSYGRSGFRKLRRNGGYEAKGENVDSRGNKGRFDFGSRSRNESRGGIGNHVHNGNYRGSGYGKLRRNDGYGAKGENVDSRGNKGRFGFGSRSRNESRGGIGNHVHNGNYRGSGYGKLRRNDGYGAKDENVELAGMNYNSDSESGYGWDLAGKSGTENGAGRRNSGNFTSNRGRRRYGGGYSRLDSGQSGSGMKERGASVPRRGGYNRFSRGGVDNMTSRSQWFRNSRNTVFELGRMPGW